MAPLTEDLAALARRYNSCGSGYYYSNGGCYRNSSWSWWGRWVFAGVVIVVLLAVLILLGCVNARRRRRGGLAPRYGTGWMASGHKYGPGYQNNPQSYNQGQNYQPPPPQYSQQPMPNQYTGNTFNSNEGYYGNHGNQNEGIALQQPQNSYYPRDGDHGYEPPSGPPPSKIH